MACGGTWSHCNVRNKLLRTLAWRGLKPFPLNACAHGLSSMMDWAVAKTSMTTTGRGSTVLSAMSCAAGFEHVLVLRKDMGVQRLQDACRSRWNNDDVKSASRAMA